MIIGVLAVAAGCTKSEIPTYDPAAGDYIQFTKAVKDSIDFTFLFHPGVQTYDIPLAIDMSGMPLSQDKTYKVVVDTELSTAVEGTHFRLPSQMVFGSGNVADECVVTLLRTPDMKSGIFRIVLRIEQTADFKTGQPDHIVSVINVTDQIAQPDWWNSLVYNYYLGLYSDLKYQKFIDVTGISDLTGAPEGMIRNYTLQFTFWLQAQAAAGTPVLETDNTPMKTRLMI